MDELRRNERIFSESTTTKFDTKYKTDQRTQNRLPLSFYFFRSNSHTDITIQGSFAFSGVPNSRTFPFSKKSKMSTKSAASISAKRGQLPDTFGFFDGREQQCLDFVRSNAARNPKGVTDAIDKFCYGSKWMMNVGDVKGKILDESLRTHRPKLVLELGTYVGYSSLRMIQQLPETSKIVSIEFSPIAAEIARAMIEHAGMSSRITVVNGYLGDEGEKTANKLESDLGFKPGCLDFVFLDHAKEAYLPDIKLIIRRKWLSEGAVAFADNVLFPGAPDYRQFMNESPLFRTREFETLLEYQEKLPDIVLESVFRGSSVL